MSDPVLYAAAYLLLAAHPAQAPALQRPTPPRPPCQLTMGMDPAHHQPQLVRHDRGKHLTVRWIGSREYYASHHRRHSHHHRGWRFSDQP